MRGWGTFCVLLTLSACADGGGAGSPFAANPGADDGSSSASGASGIADPTGDDETSDSEASSTDPSGVTGDPTDGFTTGNNIDCPPGLDACGVLCVDFQTDSANCGDCGITCVVPNANSACVAGDCSVGGCQPGWFDCDDNPGNGCEAQSGCDAGAACTTSCGSTGVTSCNGCDVVCELPAETCNAVDDDCNGSCDEGNLGGCRQGVHRSIGPNGHYYTNVLAETSQAGRTLESQDYWWMYAAQHDGLSALYRCDIGGGNTFLTTSNTCEGAGSIAATLGYLSPGSSCGSTPLYRLRSPAGRHFYTISAAERDNAINNLGYVAEGSPGQVWTGS
mgnify:CR=1 FL=1